jgi:phosphoglycerate dehydrogenase-like enzyme
MFWQSAYAAGGAVGLAVLRARARGLAQRAGTRALRVHFDDTCLVTWPQLPEQFAALREPAAAACKVTAGREALAAAGDAESVAVLVGGGRKANGEAWAPTLLALPGLRAVVQPAAGVPVGLLALFSRPELRHVALYNLHHNAPATAELAVALLLATARRLVGADGLLRDGSWEGKALPGACSLSCRTAVVVGFGAVGRRVAAVLRALGADVLATSRGAPDAAAGTPDAVTGASVFRADRLPELLPQASALVLACPLTAETAGLLGAAELALLPAGATVVNVGRAELMDEEATFRACETRRIAFGSDVWWVEPPTPRDRSPVSQARFPFGDLQNVVMTPHMGGGKGLPGIEEARARELARVLEALLPEASACARAVKPVDASAGY